MDHAPGPDHRAGPMVGVTTGVTVKFLDLFNRQVTPKNTGCGEYPCTIFLGPLSVVVEAELAKADAGQ